MRKVLCLFIVHLCLGLCLLAETENSGSDTNNSEPFLSAALYSSVDSIKTSVNIDFGYPIYRFEKFQIMANTSIVGYKLFDSNNPNLYMLGFGQRVSFGKRRKNFGEIEITRYGFTFFSIGWLSFDENKRSKQLFSLPLFYEVGGGAGFNIFATDNMSIILEVGGGMNKVIGENGYFENIKNGAFGRISVGSRYYF